MTGHKHRVWLSKGDGCTRSDDRHLLCLNLRFNTKKEQTDV